MKETEDKYGIKLDLFTLLYLNICFNYIVLGLYFSTAVFNNCSFM